MLLACAAPASAAKPPVVLVIFDEFPTTSLLGKHRQIDAQLYPSFAALARASTWYRNATTVHDSTFAAVPSILDGRRHRYVEGTRPRPPRHSLPALLARHGYRVRGSVEARGVCQRRWCGRARNTRYYLVRSRIGRLGAFIRSIRRTRRPTLYLKHTLLPHVPWTYLPSGKQYLHGPLAPLSGLNSALASDDRTLVRLAWQRHLLQVGAVDHMLGRLIRRLQATRLWRRALVVVTADHGISFRVGEHDRRAVTRANLARIAPVPLFIKAPRQRRGRVVRSYVRTTDILPTVARLLRIRVPWRTSGRPAGSRAVRRRHTVRVATRTEGKRAVRSGARRFQRGWGAAIRAQHAFFGFGVLGLYGGAHDRLLGRQVGAARRRGRLRAVILRPGDLRVRPRRRFRPSLITGRILGGARGARRPLAVAVNGRVGGVGRSFHLRGIRGEAFAVLVPDALFHPGRNHVRVMAVGRHGRLRLLGRA